MKVRYDYTACSGWFQCVQEWDAFKMNTLEGKAELGNSTEDQEGVFVREIPKEEVSKAKAAAESCPVDAITIYDDDGEQIIP